MSQWEWAVEAEQLQPVQRPRPAQHLAEAEDRGSMQYKQSSQTTQTQGTFKRQYPGCANSTFAKLHLLRYSAARPHMLLPSEQELGSMPKVHIHSITLLWQ